jgi:hypothetical protein
MRKLLACLALILLAAPALAEDTITAEADHVLWCASAFYWLANDASDVGDAEDTRYYDQWAGELTEIGIQMLREQKYTDPDHIKRIIDAYDNTVLDELGTEKARYPIESCQTLVQG